MAAVVIFCLNLRASYCSILKAQHNQKLHALKTPPHAHAHLSIILPGTATPPRMRGAVAQILGAAGPRSLQEVLQSHCLRIVAGNRTSTSSSRSCCSSSRTTSDGSSDTPHTQPQQPQRRSSSRRRVPDVGPGLADFIRSSSASEGWAAAAADGGAGTDPMKRVFIETYGAFDFVCHLVTRLCLAC